MAVREGAKSVPRERESAESFVLSIPAPALLTQVDEHTMDLYVVTPDGTTVASRVHAAVLVCVKTAAILGAVLSLGHSRRRSICASFNESGQSQNRSSWLSHLFRKQTLVSQALVRLPRPALQTSRPRF